MKGGGKRKSFDKKNRAGLYPSSPENKSAQKIQRKISSFKSKFTGLEENMSASEESDEH